MKLSYTSISELLLYSLNFNHFSQELCFAPTRDVQSGPELAPCLGQNPAGPRALLVRVANTRSLSHISGSYFARDASYSNRYSDVKIGTRNKIMFVALVLVGEYTKGSGAYVRPPHKSDGKTLYDSCVNQTSDPSIFVIFEKQQIYPEYVIKYV